MLYWEDLGRNRTESILLKTYQILERVRCLDGQMDVRMDQGMDWLTDKRIAPGCRFGLRILIWAKLQGTTRRPVRQFQSKIGGKCRNTFWLALTYMDRHSGRGGWGTSMTMQGIKTCQIALNSAHLHPGFHHTWQERATELVNNCAWRPSWELRPSRQLFRDWENRAHLL